MNAKQFFEKHSQDSPDHIASVAKSAGTTLENFRQIALYGGACSSRLAKRLSEASNDEMSVTAILFPDDEGNAA